MLQLAKPLSQPAKHPISQLVEPRSKPHNPRLHSAELVSQPTREFTTDAAQVVPYSRAEADNCNVERLPVGSEDVSGPCVSWSKFTQRSDRVEQGLVGGRSRRPRWRSATEQQIDARESALDFVARHGELARGQANLALRHGPAVAENVPEFCHVSRRGRECLKKIIGRVQLSCAEFGASLVAQREEGAEDATCQPD